ncbi:MAG: MarR family transcriptional regulator [Cytophagaceae bacterium]|nr:MarR family transcriptional regulator [Cytophagaceae bacterium]
MTTNPADERAYFFKIDTTIKKIRNSLQRQLDEAGFDLTVDQWVLLDHVCRNPGINQTELAEMTVKDTPTVTRILDLLIRKDLAERRPDATDRRKFSLHLTPAGQTLFDQALPIVVAVRRKGWGDMSDTDYQNLTRILDSIHQNVSR